MATGQPTSAPSVARVSGRDNALPSTAFHTRRRWERSRHKATKATALLTSTTDGWHGISTRSHPSTSCLRAWGSDGGKSPMVSDGSPAPATTRFPCSRIGNPASCESHPIRACWGSWSWISTDFPASTRARVRHAESEVFPAPPLQLARATFTMAVFYSHRRPLVNNDFRRGGFMCQPRQTRVRLVSEVWREHYGRPKDASGFPSRLL